MLYLVLSEDMVRGFAIAVPQYSDLRVGEVLVPIEPCDFGEVGLVVQKSERNDLGPAVQVFCLNSGDESVMSEECLVRSPGKFYESDFVPAVPAKVFDYYLDGVSDMLSHALQVAREAGRVLPSDV